MPYADPERRREYVRDYNRKWVAERRKDPAIAEQHRASERERYRRRAIDHWREAPEPRPVETTYDPDWRLDALCTQIDPELWFPEGKGFAAREAKAVCASCEVQAQCLEYALQNDERFGIWGGLSPKQRRRLKRSA